MVSGLIVFVVGLSWLILGARVGILIGCELVELCGFGLIRNLRFLLF